MSLGEALTAALVLDRSDWLRERGYSIAQALDRIGPEWAARLSEVARQFHTEVTHARLRFSFEIIPHHSDRSEEHTSELQSLMRISYAVFCLKKKQHKHKQ